jgi:hypothetical protein
VFFLVIWAYRKSEICYLNFSDLSDLESIMY